MQIQQLALLPWEVLNTLGHLLRTHEFNVVLKVDSLPTESGDALIVVLPSGIRYKIFCEQL